MRNGLTFTELSEIIKIAGESGVKRLRLAELVDIEFELSEYKEVQVPYYTDRLNVDTLETITETGHNEEDRKDSAQDFDDSVAELMITDPVAYEELQTKGDILDG